MKERLVIYFERLLSQMHSLYIPLIITILSIPYALPMCIDHAKYFTNPVHHRILPKTELVEGEGSCHYFSHFIDEAGKV